LAEQATILEGQTVTTPSVRPQGDIACVSCLDTLEESFTTECGHTYCGACLKFQCESASTYPIRCIGAEDTCKTALELRDLRKALPGDTYEAMLRTSFTKHVCVVAGILVLLISDAFLIGTISSTPVSGMLGR
jgi:hypothetical protein